MTSFDPHWSVLVRRMNRFILMVAAALLIAGCAGSKPYTLEPVKTFDPDNQPVEQPRAIAQNMYWDRVDLSVFHQLEKPLNLNWTGRQVGRLVGAAGKKQADNVNACDEPPASSWYAHRHFYDPMTPEALARGPNPEDGAGPDTSGTWTVWQGKSVGAASGFFIEDPGGDRFLIKLDKPAYPELASTAEVIATKIYYGAGYHVPQNTITYFDPDQLVVGEDATIEENGTSRPMTQADLRRVLEDTPRTESGKIRGMASRFVRGTVLGPWNYRGRRDDDPNDRVRHEHRRELRGLRVISSWLNDTDRRAANTLAVYTDDQYVKHYLQDMGSTLGANTGSPHQRIHGQAYMIDQRKIPQAWLSFGSYRFPWWHYEYTVPYLSVGYWRADIFNPGDWVPTYPNPAFEKMTLRDAFWGAKMVMSFRDEDLEAIVESAQMSNPEAEAYLLEVLKKRRDKVGRYWFARINPLDRFRIMQYQTPEIASAGTADQPEIRQSLVFDDLAVTGELESAEASNYVYSITHEGRTWTRQTTGKPSIALRAPAGAPIAPYLDQNGFEDDDERVVRVQIRTQRGDDAPGKYIRVYVHYPADGAPPRLAGIERDE